MTGVTMMSLFSILATTLQWFPNNILYIYIYAYISGGTHGVMVNVIRNCLCGTNSDLGLGYLYSTYQ